MPRCACIARHAPGDRRGVTCYARYGAAGAPAWRVCAGMHEFARPGRTSLRTSPASDFAIEVGSFVMPILEGCPGHRPGGRDDGERQAAQAPAALAGGEV